MLERVYRHTHDKACLEAMSVDPPFPRIGRQWRFEPGFTVARPSSRNRTPKINSSLNGDLQTLLASMTSMTCWLASVAV